MKVIPWIGCSTSHHLPGSSSKIDWLGNEVQFVSYLISESEVLLLPLFLVNLLYLLLVLSLTLSAWHFNLFNWPVYFDLHYSSSRYFSFKLVPWLSVYNTLPIDVKVRVVCYLFVRLRTSSFFLPLLLSIQWLLSLPVATSTNNICTYFVYVLPWLPLQIVILLFSSTLYECCKLCCCACLALTLWRVPRMQRTTINKW